MKRTHPNDDGKDFAVEGEIPVPADVDALARQCGTYGEVWRHNCHGASLKIVQSLADGRLPELEHLVEQHGRARVARGTAKGVGGQHSWVVFGDPYDQNALVLDATLWSYDRSVTSVVRNFGGRRWRPHGSGSIWDAGRPGTASESRETPIALAVEVSDDAKRFLALCGDLGPRGWMQLANSPVGGWPAAEIIAAMDDTPTLSPLVPVDILGMLTDRNPDGLYLPVTEKAAS